MMGRPSAWKAALPATTVGGQDNDFAAKGEGGTESPAAERGVKARVLRHLVRLHVRASEAHFGLVQHKVLQGGD